MDRINLQLTPSLVPTYYISSKQIDHTELYNHYIYIIYCKLPKTRQSSRFFTIFFWVLLLKISLKQKS